MNRPVFGLLICISVAASFVDTYPTFDIDREEDVWGENNVLDTLGLYQEYIRNSENRRDVEEKFGEWKGRWMPDRPGDPTPPPKIFPKNKQEYYKYYMTELAHDMSMNYVSPECDDAKTNLTVDWDHFPSAYTCYGHNFVPSIKELKIYCEFVPKAYKAAHKCMNETIEYDDDVPLYGPHRPLWPVYGEYIYLPKQRWLHSLEHGAIVMLYHPCANPLEVKRLKELVSQCLWRHIITPYGDLDEDYPLVLLSWGCKFSMSYVNPMMVKEFIQGRALQGPEQISDDGQFQDGLRSPSRIVSDPTDSVLCPNLANMPYNRF